MEAAGYTVPGWVKEQIAAQGEGMRFYRSEGGKVGQLGQLGQRGGFTPIPVDPRALSLDAIRQQRRDQCAQSEADAEVDDSPAKPFPAPPVDPSHSRNTTWVPALAHWATRSASQLVSRTHPCDSTWPMFEGSGVP